MYVSKDEREFRLEVFNGKAYAVAQTGLLDAMQTASETAPRPWRITLAAKDRPAVPKYRKPPAWNYRGDGYLGIKPFYAG